MHTHPRAVGHFHRPAVEPRAPSVPAPRRRTTVRLWLPLTPLFLILSPFALLLAALAWPFLGLAPPAWRANPFAAAFGLGRLLLSLGGTVVDVDSVDALVRIRIL